MFECPKTLEEAKKYRYRQWGGDPKGRAYIEGRCAYEVFPNGRAPLPYQCNRMAGHGPNRLYCKQHSKKVSD